MYIIAATLQTFGTVLIGITALQVHHRVLSRQKIDEDVQKDFRREQRLGVVGIVMIVAGYVAEILTFLGDRV